MLREKNVGRDGRMSVGPTEGSYAADEQQYSQINKNNETLLEGIIFIFCLPERYFLSFF
jgi:hypothetical protein